MPAMRIFFSHGGRGNEGRVQVDGLNVGAAFNGGGVSGYVYDIANAQEMSGDRCRAVWAKPRCGGPAFNIIPKTGGNTFSGTAFFSTAGEWSQGSNLDDELRSFGITEPPALIKNWDTSRRSAVRSSATGCGSSATFATSARTTTSRVYRQHERRRPDEVELREGPEHHRRGSAGQGRSTASA